MRFAILARVSTENQENDGQSLEVQTKTLKNCVQMLNGQVVKEYIGQEHATAGYERPILDELLLDLNSKSFDAVMVYDLSRITRDPIKGKFIFATLKKLGIRLFIQTQEYCFDNPETDLFIGIMTEINSYQASIQSKKAQLSKIELAKRGWSLGGLLPFGRVIKGKDKTKEAEWVLDEEKFKLAQTVYDLYVNKRWILSRIVEETGLSDSCIYDILHDTGIFKQTMTIGNEKVVFETVLPPLFTNEQKAKIKHLLQVNKRNNGTIHQYLLSGLIRCGVCGRTLTGHTLKYPNGAKRYYGYYSHPKRGKTEDCLDRVKLKLIESSVLESIGELLSNNDRLLETIKACNQNNDEQKAKVEMELSRLFERQEKLNKQKRKILKLIFNEAIDEEDVTDDLKKIKKELETINISIIAAQNEKEALVATVVPEEVLKRIQAIYRHFKGSHREWSFETKRLLVEWFFGIDKNHGVFVGGNKGDESYTIKSCLGVLAFGWLGDEGAAGITGQEVARASINMPEFTSIISNLGGNGFFNTKSEALTRKQVRLKNKGWMFLKVVVAKSLIY